MSAPNRGGKEKKRREGGKKPSGEGKKQEEGIKKGREKANWWCNVKRLQSQFLKSGIFFRFTLDLPTGHGTFLFLVLHRMSLLSLPLEKLVTF